MGIFQRRRRILNRSPGRDRRPRAETLEARVLLASDVLHGAQWWTELDTIPDSSVGAVSYLQPQTFEPFALTRDSLSTMLDTAPLEFTSAADNPLLLALPTPQGNFETFAVVEAPVMAPELAAKFPEINTYRGQSVDNPANSLRFDITPAGFHAQVLGPDGGYLIDPYYHLDQSVYVSYARSDFQLDPITADLRGSELEIVKNIDGSTIYRSDVGDLSLPPAFDAEHPPEGFHTCHTGHCHAEDGSVISYAEVAATLPSGLDVEPIIVDPYQSAELDPGEGDPPVLDRTGQSLRTYRLANATTVEYTNYHGGTKSAGMAAVVTAVNRVTQVYEIELTVRMELVPDNDDLIFVGSDSYSNFDGFAMLSQNQSVIDSMIGNGNYDIGHVFSTGGGGVAYLGVVGESGFKARGVTGLSNPINDPFYIDYVAHEMGHQYGATHTFNGDSSSCSGGNRTGSTAYEPGSGSTIMAYAGICGNDNLQGNSDPYFHSASLDQIISYLDNSVPFAGTRTATGNSVPVADAGPNYTIPTETAYRLTGSATDADGDLLTYNWEERDLGPQRDVNASDNGSSPIFRSWNATSSPTRYLPRLQNLVNNTTVRGEMLPTVARNNHRWRLTVRDNVAGGAAVDTDDMVITVVDNGGPFQVLSPNSGGVSWAGGDTETVTWDVAGTNSGTVNTPNVNIRLSTDGGFTYPILLASEVPNNGSYDITVPSVTTSQGRVMVEGAGNIFFDISNANIQIDGSDTAGPTATAVADDIITPGGSTQTITVTYTDPAGVSVADIDTNDIEIVGPDDQVTLATPIDTSSPTNTSPLVVTYEMAAPGDSWDFADNGTYTVNLVAGEVDDDNGNTNSAATLTTFLVDIDAPGDFDGDGDLDCDDVQQLGAAIQGNSTDTTFDLDGDMDVDIDDLNYWITDIKGTELGDANLDFVVDGADFQIWNQNKFQSGTSWCTADFNADGVTDGRDLLIWNNNKTVPLQRFVQPATAPSRHLKLRQAAKLEMETPAAASPLQPAQRRALVTSRSTAWSYDVKASRAEEALDPTLVFSGKTHTLSKTGDELGKSSPSRPR